MKKYNEDILKIYREKSIKELLDKFQISKAFLGYYFWEELIKESLEINNITQIKIGSLIPSVAKKFDSTAQKVERNLRTVLLRNESTIKEFFGAKGKITTKTLVFLCVYYIKTREDTLKKQK